MDLLAPLKWPEFHALKREMASHLDEGMVGFAFADVLNDDDSAAEPDDVPPSGAVAVSRDRVLVVRTIGSFVRRISTTALEALLDDVEFSWESRALGWRRSLTISLPSRKVELIFAPLWYQETRRLKDTLDHRIPGNSP